MKLTAKAERTGKWWAVEVPEVPGLFTQTKRLDQVDAMVREAAALLTGESEDSFEIKVEPVVAGDVVAILRESVRLTDEAAETKRRASENMFKAAASMQDQGLTVRDIAVVVGVSHQRISQVLTTKAQPRKRLREKV